MRKVFMDETKETRPAKKPYVKPQLQPIELKAEEAVLGGCKVAGISGPGSSGNCSTPSNCYTISYS